jgi:hypothetical protein
MLGEIGRLYDVVFIETTQIGAPLANPADYINTAYDDGTAAAWRGGDSAVDGTALTSGIEDGPNLDGLDSESAPDAVATPGWDQKWPSDPQPDVYEALMLGDNAFGHAISLPVELRDGGVLDFGREHALAWYSIWGFGLITDSAVVKIRTN